MARHVTTLMSVGDDGSTHATTAEEAHALMEEGRKVWVDDMATAEEAIALKRGAASARAFMSALDKGSSLFAP